MTNLSNVSDSVEFDNTPLPLIVAKHFNFPLAHIQTEAGLYYAIVDWMLAINNTSGKQKLAYLLRKSPQLQASIKLLPYGVNYNGRIREPHTDEENLIYILKSFRIDRWDSPIVKIRNFIAKIRPEYQYLKCLPPEYEITEQKFQSMIINTLKKTAKLDEIHEYFMTPLERKIDILVIRKCGNNLPPPYLLIECKLSWQGFFSAIGQLYCYNTEISQTVFPKSNYTLALAMPDEIIDDYMRQMASLLSIHLITIVNGSVIDAVTGEPFSFEILGR